MKFQKVGGHGFHARLDVQRGSHDRKRLRENVMVYHPMVGEARLEEVGV